MNLKKHRPRRVFNLFIHIYRNFNLLFIVIVPIQPEEPTVPVVEPLEDQAESVIEKKSEPTRESAEQRDVGAWELGVEKTRQAIVGMQEKSAPQRPSVVNY